MARPKSTPSRGSQELRKLAPEHGDVKTLAERLGKPDYLVSKWLHGKRKPTGADREHIQQVLGIDWRLWERPAVADPSLPITDAELGGAPSATFQGARVPAVGGSNAA